MDYKPAFYALLGVPLTATEDEIQAAFRRAAQRFHPDVNPNQGASLHFAQIKEAHQTLSSTTRRIAYDAEHKKTTPALWTIDIVPSKTVLAVMAEKQVAYALVTVQANETVLKTHERAHIPLNIALVLDRSSSMRGERLDRVRYAANKIIDELQENDYLSIVIFSDRAERMIPSTRVTRTEREHMKAIVNLMTASGGTEIFQGLEMGLAEVTRSYQDHCVNHVVLLTDGRTYDQEFLSLELADRAIEKGIGISAMGIGDEWNDIFLDDLAARTGGASAYIAQPDQVERFLNQRVRSLGSAYAERLTLNVIPEFDVTLEQAFKLNPTPQPVSIERQPLQLGTLEGKRAIKMLLQLKLPANMAEGERPILRLDITGDVLQARQMGVKSVYDLTMSVEKDPPMVEPPRAIIDALGKLTLYRMQQKAEAAMQRGEIDEATRHMTNLSTRLEAVGQVDLARTVQMETIRIQATRQFSEEGRKTIKFGTRMLLPDQDEGKTHG